MIDVAGRTTGFLSAVNRVAEPADLFARALGLGPDRDPLAAVDTDAAGDDVLAAMAGHGVDRAALYPARVGRAGERLTAVADPGLARDCVRTYNDWLLDAYGDDPRLLPMCLVPVHDVGEAVAELRRAVAAGACGVVLPALPMFLRDDAPEITAENHRELFAACEELGVPISFPAGFTHDLHAPPYASLSPAAAAAYEWTVEPMSAALYLAHLLLSQVVVDHPGLGVILPSNSVGWVAFALETMDYLVTVDRLNVDTYPLLPSEVFRRQFFCVGSFEDLPALAADVPPPATILWSAHLGFPPGEPTRSPTEALAGLAPDVVEAICHGNAERAYPRRGGPACS